MCVCVHARARSLALRPSFRCRRRLAVLARVHRTSISTNVTTTRRPERRDDDVDVDVKTTAENGTAKTGCWMPVRVSHRPATCVHFECDARTGSHARTR